MKHKVSELQGALLDAAVALAEGRQFDIIPGAPHGTDFLIVPDNQEGRDSWEPWSPSRLWRDGGPIIEREQISVFPRLSNLFEPIDWASVKHVYPEAGQDRLPDGKRLRYVEQHAPTPLIAAMRAFCASRLGEEVELP